MSHYSLLVIGDNVDEQLAPYDEHLQVDPFREALDEEDLKDWAWWQAKHPGDDGTRLFGSPVLRDEQGLYKISTYNWNRKFDWYMVGGGWRGRVLRVKPTVAAYVSTPRGTKGIEPKMGYADICRKGDVDWEGIARDAEASARREWRAVHAILAQHPPVTPWSTLLKRHKSGELSLEQAREQYHAQLGVVAFGESDLNSVWSDLDDYQCTEEEFAQRAVAESGTTYAVLKDGQWYEEGDTGDGAGAEWNRRFHELIDDLPDDALLTVVDYHVV